jgi:hypothetical protein
VSFSGEGGACGRWGLKSVVDACRSNVTVEKTHSILKSVSDAGFKIIDPHSWERVAGAGGGGRRRGGGLVGKAVTVGCDRAVSRKRGC